MIVRLAGWLVVAGGVASAVAMAAIMIVMLIEVFARYVVGRPTSWALEMVSYLLVACACLGAAYTLRTNAHIAVDVLRRRLPRAQQEWLFRATGVVALGVSVVLMIWGAREVAGSIRLGDVSLTPLAVPLWIPQSSVAVGGLLLTIESVLLLFGKGLAGLDEAPARRHAEGE